RRTSGSAPRFPTKITLFTLPAMTLLHARPEPVLSHLTAYGSDLPARALLSHNCLTVFVLFLFYFLSPHPSRLPEAGGRSPGSTLTSALEAVRSSVAVDLVKE